MADKMMRVAGRTSGGKARSLSLNNEGHLRAIVMNERQYLGDFVEPYDIGYVGNVALSGLEVFGKVEFTQSAIIDVKAGKNAVFVLQQNKVLTKLNKQLDEVIWTYSVAEEVSHLRVDTNDNPIVASNTGLGWRIVEKINGETGVITWRTVNSSANYIMVQDIFVDFEGNVYTIGKANGDNLSHTILFTKQSGADGSVIWSYNYDDLHQLSRPYLAIQGNSIFVASRWSIRKIDQTFANITTPPTTEWAHPLEQYPLNRAFNAQVILDNENTAYVYSADDTNYYLVKYDFSVVNVSTPPQEVHRLTLAANEESVTNYRPQMDLSGNIYIAEGKFDGDLNTIWHDEVPIVIHELHDGYLFGNSGLLGRYGESVFEVFKLGLDLQIKGYKGVGQ